MRWDQAACLRPWGKSQEKYRTQAWKALVLDSRFSTLAWWHQGSGDSSLWKGVFFLAAYLTGLLSLTHQEQVAFSNNWIYVSHNYNIQNNAQTLQNVPWDWRRECHHFENDQIRLTWEDIRCSFAWSWGIVSCVTCGWKHSSWMYSRHMASTCTGSFYCHDRVLMMVLSTQHCLISPQRQDTASTEDLMAPWTFSPNNILSFCTLLLSVYSVFVAHGSLSLCMFMHVDIHVYACLSQRSTLGVILRNTIYLFRGRVSYWHGAHKLS